MHSAIAPAPKINQEGALRLATLLISCNRLQTTSQTSGGRQGVDMQHPPSET
jgi:hypothetical protein